MGKQRIDGKMLLDVSKPEILRYGKQILFEEGMTRFIKKYDYDFNEDKFLLAVAFDIGGVPKNAELPKGFDYLNCSIVLREIEGNIVAK